MTTSEFDFIIVGGGIGGSVVASRLYEALPHLSILLIEAGPNVADNPLVTEIKNAFQVEGSAIDWSYKSVPQQHLNNRICTSIAGKCLGGGSAINFFGWVRGDANDYDAWAKVVDDPKWSYQGLLPYFKKTEHYHSQNDQHGVDGPLYTQSVTSSKRKYPLRDRVLAAWESAGVKFNPDGNSGSPQGIAELVENLNDGARQIASSVYPLAGVQVMDNTLVATLVIDEKKVKGVKLLDGRVLTARKEVILSAGAIATPQLMLLSGIGAKEDLEPHGIKQVLNLPEVGKNLHGHMCVSQWWKLRNPKAGLAVGAINFDTDSLVKGFPGDWVITQPVPHDGMKAALAVDENGVTDLHPLLYPPRSHVESFLVYVAGNASNPMLIPDGTHVTTTVMGFLPTSRGSIKLASTDPTTPPLFDPNYYATEADRYVMRTGLRQVMHVMMETDEGKAMVNGQAMGEGKLPLGPNSSNEDIDEMVRERGNGISHTMGTAAMGKVVDSNLCVYGIEGLRVVDASIIPVPIASHIQACIYALAEQAADIIVKSIVK